MPRLRLGPVDALASARVIAYPSGTPPRRSVLAVKTPSGVRAYWNVCQHLPIPLDAGAGTLGPGPELVCVTHGAAYEPEHGRCVRGPCVGSALEPIPVTVEDGVAYAVL